jgi:hypothetical protein
MFIKLVVAKESLFIALARDFLLSCCVANALVVVKDDLFGIAMQ